jgi:membrane-associated protease RseP (regulator of RpoE activity)
MERDTASGAMRSVCLALLAVLLAAPTFAQEQDDFVGFGFFFASDRDGRVIVTGVAPGGAAEAAGLEAGDEILEIGGETMTPFNEGDPLGRARETLPAPMVVARGADTLTLSLGVGPYRLSELRVEAARFTCVRGDCVDGIGRWVKPDGAWYDGPFARGLPHGRGVDTDAEGRVYVGPLVRGDREGEALYRWPDGSYWTGLWRDNQPVPPGVYTDETGESRPGLPD